MFGSVSLVAYLSTLNLCITSKQSKVMLKSAPISLIIHAKHKVRTMNSSKAILRHSYAVFWRNFSRCPKLATTAIDSAASTAAPLENLTIPPPSNVDKPVSAKIEKLVGEISQLNLIEVSELSGALKKRLNLPDAPVMPMGMAVGPAGAQADEDEAEPQKAKTSFTVKLMKFDEKQKVALIKEIKSLMEGMNLVQAKKFVESAPTVVKADIGKDEAEKLKEALVKVGAEIDVD